MLLHPVNRNAEPLDGGNGLSPLPQGGLGFGNYRGINTTLIRELTTSVYGLQSLRIIDRYGDDLAAQLAALASSKELCIEVQSGEMLILSPDESVQVRTNAARLIREIRPPALAAIPALLAALDDSAPSLRREAARTIGWFGPLAHRAVPLLIVALTDADDSVREAAAAALGSIGSGARAAMPDLVKALNDSSDFVRKNAAAALASLGVDAVPQAVQVLTTGTLQAREAAGLVLRYLGPAAKDAVPVLIEELKDPEAKVRCSAAWALGAVGAAAAPAIPALFRMAAFSEGPSASVAICVLRSVGSGGIEKVVNGLTHHESLMRQAAAEVLSEMAAPEAFDALAHAALKDDTATVRFYAVKALQQHRARAIPTLTAALSDQERSVRDAVGEVLRAMGYRVCPESGRVEKNADHRIGD